MHIRIYVYASSTITTTFFFLWVTQRGSYFRHYPIFGMSWRPCHIDTLIPTSLLSWLYDILSCLLLTAWVSITPNSAQTTTVCSSYALLPRNTPTPRPQPPSPVPCLRSCGQEPGRQIPPEPGPPSALPTDSRQRNPAPQNTGPGGLLPALGASPEPPAIGSRKRTPASAGKKSGSRRRRRPGCGQGTARARGVAQPARPGGGCADCRFPVHSATVENMGRELGARPFFSSWSSFLWSLRLPLYQSPLFC